MKPTARIKNPDEMTPGEIIETALRLAQPLTANEISEITGIAKSLVQYLKNGERDIWSIRVTTLMKLKKLVEFGYRIEKKSDIERRISSVA